MSDDDIPLAQVERNRRQQARRFREAEAAFLALARGTSHRSLLAAAVNVVRQQIDLVRQRSKHRRYFEKNRLAPEAAGQRHGTIAPGSSGDASRSETGHATAEEIRGGEGGEHEAQISQQDSGCSVRDSVAAGAGPARRFVPFIPLPSRRRSAQASVGQPTSSDPVSDGDRDCSGAQKSAARCGGFFKSTASFLGPRRRPGTSCAAIS